MASTINLLTKDHCNYTAKLYGTPISGEIHAEGHDVFLLHNDSTHIGMNPPNGVRNYKYGWNVHIGDSVGLTMGGVTDFKLVDDHTMKFPVGTRIKLSTSFTDSIQKFRFGGDITTIPSLHGIIINNYGWNEECKCCKVSVQWDAAVARTSFSYTMLENELELYLGERVETLPRDLPGRHIFTVGNHIRLKSGLEALVYTGAIRGDERDTGVITACEGFDRSSKCMKVAVKFIDGRNYAMSENELEFSIPKVIYNYKDGDILLYENINWLVVRSDTSSITIENEYQNIRCIVKALWHTLSLVKSSIPLLDIYVGQYLNAKHIETWSSWNSNKCPCNIVRPEAIVKVTNIGTLRDISDNPYRMFSFEWAGTIYDATLGRENIYTVSNGITVLGSLSTSANSIGSASYVSAEAYNSEIERNGAGYAEHILQEHRSAFGSSSPRNWYTGVVFDPQPLAGVKKVIDPKADREKYLCGTDPFEKISIPTKDLIMKKEKKFSL